MKKIFIQLLIVLLFSSTCHSQDYDRSLFPHWIDLDGDGLNTRDEMILQDRVAPEVWVCPYTGDVFADPAKMDIDHIVPLKYAWDHGADKWNIGKRTAFANDPFNLLAVSYDVNRSKGSKGPKEWLPPNMRFVPAYIEWFSCICDKYGLTYDHESFEVIKAQYEQVRKGGPPVFTMLKN
jgi:5-methylcytosine-specific restriction endonuclease McrA